MLGKWLREDGHAKAVVIAHFWERNMREAYAWEKARADHKDPNRPEPPQNSGVVEI
jgi:hypothetical protein